MSQEESPPPEPPGRVLATLRQPLTRLQAGVGLLTGFITITGTLASLVGFSASRPVDGELVSFVHDARSRRAVAGATVEVRTRQDAIVTTLSTESTGQARYRLREGQYRLRVSHPRYASEVRQIEIQAGGRADVPVGLTTPASPPVTKTATEGQGSLAKFFRGLGL